MLSREVARLLQVEFADIAHTGQSGHSGEGDQDQRKAGATSPAVGVAADTADFLALAGVAFAEEPPMSPSERNQHVTFILEWLRKRDRVINTVVTPAMHIACLNSDAGITVEYVAPVARAGLCYAIARCVLCTAGYV